MVADDTAVKHINHIKDKKEAVVAMNVSIFNVNLPELVGACDYSIAPNAEGILGSSPAFSEAIRASCTAGTPSCG
ncbi:MULTISPECIES: hypothetical protein [unclassified Paenibacillus]|uniref:hypothetical protein n=1 Tax=unclassified Paenibacillus TaxID=185978 RepID=UPI002405B44B|nr:MULTISPECIES: hypothetical protein [unclassified Paenibacillus]MDF9845505.1 hypothetical protein [Paenibacillus sp. PastF-2]MDF9852081.1 hypothetical protein [Paenibacillus sp. PastM-2]MDF9858671.1 hypothetical protein [Paenibacillus sp. PastF-1]MDH6483919.1 hypothetical protein [Paenibacillus sp. PastH-2]